MSNGKSGSDQEKIETPHDSDDGDDTDDESDILEESPCGRWQKRREEVQQQEVPGIDHAFLAMDTEEGVEVVWNEVQFSEKKSFKTRQEEIKQVFQNLINLDHANIAKLHMYWFDTTGEAPRVIFITEYMSSGSLKQFLIRSRKKKITDKRSLKAWKRWTTQILSAVSYLHNFNLPIIHGNLTLDKIFLQHNGLIKISSVAPDAIHNHVRTCKDQLKNMHYIAPEYGGRSVTPAVDIYSFGICALEMITSEDTMPITGGDSGNPKITEDMIQKAIASLEDDSLKDFISLCLTKDPAERPTARQLFFHPSLFEVQSLKMFAAHALVSYTKMLPNESVKEEVFQSLRWDPQTVLATVTHSGTDKEDVEWKYSQLPSALELEKFIEDVKNGVYPMLCAQLGQPAQQQMRAGGRADSPEVAESVASESPEPNETRRLVHMTGTIVPNDQGSHQLSLQFKMADKMNRHISREMNDSDSANSLAQELVHYRFINEADYDNVRSMIEDMIANSSQPAVPSQSAPTHAVGPSGGEGGTGPIFTAA